MSRSLVLVAIAFAPALLVACLTRLTNDDRTEGEFWGTVSADTETAVRELDDPARADLVAALPDAERETSWQEVLDVLDDRPSLEPLADRIRFLADREIDAGVRVELASPAGNARLRDLILSSIKNALAAERDPG